MIPKLFSVIERQLSLVCGNDDGEQARHAGSVEGPTLVFKPALEQCGLVMSGALAAQAWCLTAKWLRTWACIGIWSPGGTRLRNAVPNHSHSGTGDQMDVFRSWQSSLSIHMLWNLEVVALIPQASSYMADCLCWQMAELSIIRWPTWLCEGPAKGLRRQHRMSSVAIGWIAPRQSERRSNLDDF